MSQFGSLLGLNSGNTGGAGMNYQAGSANIANPVSQPQIDAAYGNAQSGLAQQQAFINALQAQNGIQNQSNVYNQLQGVANGTGPNPAQAMLANSTGQNTANQAALMAGQRGAGANTGLVARQAAMQGAANQQNAAGQGAALQANQSMNAINSMGGIAGQQVANHANAIQGYNQGAQSEQQNLLGSQAAYNNANVANMQSQNAANAGVSGNVANQQGKFASGALNSAGMGLLKFAQGGVVPSHTPPSAPHHAMAYLTGSKMPEMMANGGFLYGSAPDPIGLLSGTPGPVGFSQVPNLPDDAKKEDDKPKADPLSGTMQVGHSDPSATLGGGEGETAMAGEAGGAGGLAELAPLAMMAAKGGQVPALLSPGERYLNPVEAQKAAEGKVDPLKIGKKVPGIAPVKGNSYQNDTVPAKLEEGGVVIPRSVMQSKNPAKEAHKFVSAIMAKQNMKRK
jgi:hypothetical protein